MGCRAQPVRYPISRTVQQMTRETRMGQPSYTEFRILPIHPHISDLVANLRTNSTDGFLLSGLTFNKYNDRSNAIGKRFGRLKTKLGYDSAYVFHSLRKGVASQLEAAGIPENVAARLLGQPRECPEPHCLTPALNQTLRRSTPSKHLYLPDRYAFQQEPSGTS